MRLVITVAPQKDICPHGSTYPIKAIIIKVTKIIIPENQVCFILYEENNMFREMCMKIRMKNIDAPFMCIIRMFHP